MWIDGCFKLCSNPMWERSAFSEELDVKLISSEMGDWRVDVKGEGEIDNALAWYKWAFVVKKT